MYHGIACTYRKLSKDCDAYTAGWFVHSHTVKVASKAGANDYVTCIPELEGSMAA
jgi:hypothetical protein